MVAKNDIKVNITADQANFQRAIDASITRIKKMEAETLRGTARMEVGLKRLGSALFGVLAGGAVLYYANQVSKIADEYQNVEARLKLVTDSSEDLANVQERLYKASNDTGTSYAANADSYSKLAFAMRDLGAESNEILDVTEMVNKSLIVNGSTSEMAGSFMLQFAQAMGSGVLQGDEFRAMLESNSFFAGQLARALGTDIAGLRQMSKEGKLTTEVLRDAFPKMAAEINSSFATIPPTVGRATQALKNAFERIIGDSDKAGKGTKTVADAILNLAQQVDANRDEITALFVKVLETIPSVVAGIGTVAGAISDLIGMTKNAGLGGMEMGIVGALLFKGSPGAALLFANLAALNHGLKQYGLNIGNLKTSWDGYRTAVDNIIDVFSGKRDWNTGELKLDVSQMMRTAEAAFAEIERQSKKAYDAAAKSATDSAKVQQRVTEDALKEMKKQYQNYVSEIKRLNDQILSEEKSLDQQLRDLAREGMSAPDAWADKKKQAEDYAVVATAAAETGAKALEAGDREKAKEMYQVAIEYAEMAKRQFGELGNEVKEGDKVFISQAEAIKTAMAGVESSSKVKIDALKGMQQAAHDAMNELSEKSGFEDLTEGMKDAEKRWLDNWQKMRFQAIKDIDAVEERLLKIKDKEITVWINEKVRRQEASSAASASGANSVEQAVIANAINAIAARDQVSAMPSQPAVTSRAFSAPTAIAAAPTAGKSSGHYTIDFNLPGSSTPVRLSSDRENLDRLLRAAERMRRLGS